MKRICLFAASSMGARASYAQAAAAFGQLVASRGIGLVYGGAHVGLMGVAANAALAAGGEVIGIIPQSLVDRELAHYELTALHIVASMHERKAMMSELSDGFAVLPGGIGTMEELFEVLTWSQLGFHQKPCGLINIDGYFDRLLGFLDHAVAERLLPQLDRDRLLVAEDANGLLERFHDYRPPAVREKWLDSEDEL
ncbi:MULTISPECIES: TIGR00730 family Rossman fold protein [Rhodomicrobium]|uniref:LOG family protein n=1 Tax=Rhodomicrobium TaxID=1068 RepID=UPI000B4BDC06|nr:MULTISPECIES: TIGR00730 family Rossman fold protein [Rhodomicrobium]